MLYLDGWFGVNSIRHVRYERKKLEAWALKEAGRELRCIRPCMQSSHRSPLASLILRISHSSFVHGFEGQPDAACVRAKQAVLIEWRAWAWQVQPPAVAGCPSTMSYPSSGTELSKARETQGECIAGLYTDDLSLCGCDEGTSSGARAGKDGGRTDSPRLTCLLSSELFQPCLGA